MSYQLIRLSAGIEMRVDIPGRLLLVDSVTTGQGVDIALLRNGTPSPKIPGRMPGFRMVEDFGGVILTSALDCEVGIFLSVQDVQLGGTAGGAVMVPEGVNITNNLANSIPVTLTSSSNTTPIPVSLASIRINNTSAQPVPVSFSGTVEPVLGTVTIDNTTDEAIPVTQKPGAQFEVRTANTAADAVYVRPGAGVTFPVSLAGESPVRTYLAAAVTNAAAVNVTAAVGVLLAAVPARRSIRLRNVGASAIAIGATGLTFANAAVIIQPGETWIESDAPGAAWYCICDTGLTSKFNIQTVA